MTAAAMVAPMTAAARVKMSISRGAGAEQIACGWLTAGGVRIKQQNFHCRFGEIDIIAEHGDTLCFIEVRYRKTRAYGDAAESVTQTKRRRLAQTARHYLMRHPAEYRRPCRFDIIAMHGNMAAPEIDWHQNAFSMDDV